jgi:hypothetical protein
LRRPSHAKPGFACMTAPVVAGATQRSARRTAPTSRPISTRCWPAPAFPGRTWWPVTRSAGCTCAASPRNSPMTSPAWCYWSPPLPTGPGPATTDRVRRRLRSRRRVTPAVAHLGAGRLIAQFSHGSLPPRSRDEACAEASTARHLASFIEEYAVANTSIHRASSLTNLNGKPLIVLTAEFWVRRGMATGAGPQATLSTNSLHRVARPRLRRSQPGNSRRRHRGANLSPAPPTMMVSLPFYGI